jgi:hypothetical protein
MEPDRGEDQAALVAPRKKLTTRPEHNRPAHPTIVADRSLHCRA